MKIRLLMLGKTRRPEMRAVIDDYVKRIGHRSPIEITEIRDAGAALKKIDADRAAVVVLLDAAGKSFSSEAFAKWLADQRDRGTRELTFLCGDADGFPNTCLLYTSSLLLRRSLLSRSPTRHRDLCGGYSRLLRTRRTSPTAMIPS